MRMTSAQKIEAAFGAFSALSDIKRLLIRRYWDRRKIFILDFAGVHAQFSTADFYSNHWFYGPQNEKFVYEPAVTRLLIERLPGSRAFADVGANLGYFTVIGSVILNDAPVFAFELDTTLTPLITRNLLLNGRENVQVICSAVSDVNGASFAYTPHPFSFVEQITGLDTSPFQVRFEATTLNLDSYFANKPVLPDFLKIDVDGAEMAVLRGMSRILAQPKVQMLLEVHAHHLPHFRSSAGAVLEFLYKHGFKTYFLEHFRNDPRGSLREVFDASDVTAVSGDLILVTRHPV